MASTDPPGGSEHIPSNEEFSMHIKQGYEALMPAIRASNSLPKGDQWDLLRTSSNFLPIMDSLGKKTLELMSMILTQQGINRDIRKRDLEEKYELIVDANDNILERVGIHLDELSGIKRNPIQIPETLATSRVAAISGSWNKNVSETARWKEVTHSKNNRFSNLIVLRNARVTQRPQAKFQDKIDNSSSPFEPRIKDKPNALKPLAILLEQLPGEDPCYSHPYEFELDRFQEKIDKLNLERKEPQLPKDIENTPLIFVSDEIKLMDMLEDLKTHSEIAVDLEHHSYRSFQGFTCLMQISTREKDYIVDTLELRHKLYVLNEVFTDPKIVKVFHGADSDIVWLQRDLSLYVVNMFDTYQASFTLSLPKLSLAYLLHTTCNVQANKTFQLYDWRNRPLAQEAIKYAREDTHYLLYIYEVLWNRLLEMSNGGTQLLQTVLYRSADTCKKRYWKPIFENDSHEKLYRQSKKNFDNRQMYALKELYAWRDKISREEDESSGYTLPTHMLLLISEKLPKEMQGILACCNPIPPLVRQNLVLLHQIVLKARDQPLITRVATELGNETRIRPTPQTNINLEGPLHCPHDMSHSADFRNDLPTLLNAAEVDLVGNISLMEKQATINVFADAEESVDSNSKTTFPNQIHFMSPFERYKKMIMYIESEESKSNQENQDETEKNESVTERKNDDGECTATLMDSSIVIKQETQDYSTHSRKRNRSQSPTVGDISVSGENLNITIKSETSLDATLASSENHSNDDSVILLGSVGQTPTCKLEKNYPYKEGGYSRKSKKKKHNKDSSVSNMNVANKKNTVPEDSNSTFSSDSFTQYDYSQVDYTDFQQPDGFSLQRTPNDKFRHKGKKKNQNRSFTFSRQYGRGNREKPY